MTYCAANGVPVVEAAVRFPRVGVWNADLTIDGNTLAAFQAGTPVTITAGGQSWPGTVRRAGLTRDRVVALIAGGAGGLNQLLAPKGYRGVSARTVLADLLSATGETLARSVDASLTGQYLGQWSRIQQTGGEALASLLRALGPDLAWRIQADGTLWFGREAWPAASLDYVLLSEEPGLARVRISAEAPTIAPGQTLDGRRVSFVEHHFGRELRTRLWFED